MKNILLTGFFLHLLVLLSCDQQDRRPNILLAISDDQSWPHASAYGYEAVNTPAFDRVAREGILFNQTFSPAPGCSPTRASVLTGRYIWELEDAGSHASEFPTKYKVFTDLLEQAGYHIGYTQKGWGPGNWKVSGRLRNPAGPVYSDIKDEHVPPHVSTTDYTANFEYFLNEGQPDQPFFFWYGASETHRRYDTGIGEREGLDIDAVVVPPFLPDVQEVRSDMLDYLYEIQHFDKHLGRMVKKLEEIGELDNTIIIVTSDNGMPFPRAKANLYEYGFHMPMAIRWGDKVKEGRVVDDLISLTDLAPTLLEITGIEHPSATTGEYPMSGKSFVNILLNDGSGVLDPEKEAVFAGRERHSSSRWNNNSYPIRSIRTHDYLYIRNFKPERWPAGAPEKYDEDSNLVSGYHDIDDFKESYLFIHREDPAVKYYFDLAVEKRPAEELFDIRKDPGCLENLAKNPDYGDVLIKLRTDLENELKRTNDPRVTGNGDIWETYVRYSPIRRFPRPDWAE